MSMSHMVIFNLYCTFLFILISSVCYGLDSITAGQFVTGNQTLSSQNGTFQLGFFTPGKSGNYYIGIWYTISLPDKVVVWVANREQPILNPLKSKLQLLHDGNLVVLNESGNEIWSTHSTADAADSNSTVAKLLDSGNFVVGRKPFGSTEMLWQSFDYPSNHWLPGGKIGYNKLKGIKQKLRPWRSAENPAPSVFSVEVEENGTSHVLLWNDTKMYWSTGEWNGKVFKLIPEIALNFYIKNLSYVENKNESYFTYEPGVQGALTRFMMHSTGQLQQYVWGKGFTGWMLFWSRPNPQCEVYAFCGVFSSCNNDETPLCKCLPGFEPSDVKNWEVEDHTEGCTRIRPLQCNRGGESGTFSTVSRIRFPSDEVTLPLENADSCRLSCLKNCTCVGYAYDEGRCLHWIKELLNLVQLKSDDTTGKDIYIKVSASDQVKAIRSKSKSKTVWIIVGASIGFFCSAVVMILLIIRKRRPRTSSPEPSEEALRVFKYWELRNATKNFSVKLGEGGFGFVYKGTLPNSSVIAVKRLKNVNQGKNQEKQFRAEVSTIGTIQHMNLVRLRGFCTQKSARFLVFDYMINGSLEHKLFSKDSALVDWNTRYKIAVGIARGLEYLHEKCRDCIIHCDIKPENILLDEDLNPKIGDFGLAKLIGREFSRVLTTVRGTRGYLAPEWISGEPITPKADVFSYGMLLLEIVSGRRNTGCHSSEDTSGFFPAHAANKVWRGEDIMGLLDERLGGEGDEEEVGRLCRVACWCIQEEEMNRPSMGRVVHVLEGLSEVGVFPVPKFLKGFVDGNAEPIPFVVPFSGTSLSSSF